MKWGRPRIETARVGDYAFDFFDFVGFELVGVAGELFVPFLFEIIVEVVVEIIIVEIFIIVIEIVVIFELFIILVVEIIIFEVVVVAIVRRLEGDHPPVTTAVAVPMAGSAGWMLGGHLSRLNIGASYV